MHPTVRNFAVEWEQATAELTWVDLSGVSGLVSADDTVIVGFSCETIILRQHQYSSAGNPIHLAQE